MRKIMVVGLVLMSSLSGAAPLRAQEFPGLHDPIGDGENFKKDYENGDHPRILIFPDLPAGEQTLPIDPSVDDYLVNSNFGPYRPYDPLHPPAR